MKKHVLVGLSVLLMSQSVFAGVLTLNGESRRVNNVPVAVDGSVTIEGRVSPLYAAGAGLRAKKVAIINVKVYVAQLLISEPSRFVRTLDDALASLDSESTVAMQLNFVRNVDADDVQGAFRDSLAANHINTATGPIKAFLDAVTAGGDAIRGKTLVLVGEKLSDGTEVVTYENNAGQVTSIQGEAGFVSQILSIWLGKTTDSGLAKLKKSIIEGSN